MSKESSIFNKEAFWNHTCKQHSCNLLTHLLNTSLHKKGGSLYYERLQNKKKFLSNLGLQSDASGTGNQIANDSTCGDEEIIFLSDSLWVIIWKSNIMIQVLTGSRVWPVRAQSLSISRFTQSMLFGIFGPELSLPHFQRSCVWNTGSAAERLLGHSVGRATGFTKNSTCCRYCLVNGPSSSLFLHVAVVSQGSIPHVPSYNTGYCHKAEETLQVYQWVKNEKGESRASTRHAERIKHIFPSFKWKLLYHKNYYNIKKKTQGKSKARQEIQ